MDYTYFLEKLANKNLSSSELYIENSLNIIYIICYHVTTTSKYPFLQFMMEKIPYDNKVIDEQFTLPFIMCNDNIMDIKDIVLNKVRHAMKKVCKDTSLITEDMYKGIVIENTQSCKTFAVVNITGIDILGLHRLRNDLTWFVLPSEIINAKKICNIEIDYEVRELFTRIPRLALLTNTNTNTNKITNTFIIPDVVYSGGEYKKAEFNSVFCNSKTKEFDNCGEYFYFYNSFEKAVRFSGWTKEGGEHLIDENNKLHTHSSSDRLLVDNEYGRYILGGINRYAIFVEGDHYIETEYECSLTDELIEILYTGPTITISYENTIQETSVKPDILAKHYESFTSLSYHGLNKISLGQQYKDTDKHMYRII